MAPSKQIQQKHGSIITAAECAATKCGALPFDENILWSLGSRILNKVYPTKSGLATYFVTSEKDSNKTRYYLVWKQIGREITGVGTFQQYCTALLAKTAAKKLAGA